MKKLVKVSRRVYYLTGENSTDRPYLYYIKGENYSVVIDAGNSKNHVEEFYNAIKAENMPLPHYTILTHWHWDHTFGIPYVQGKTIANVLTNQKLEEVRQWKWTLLEMKKREEAGSDIAFCNECIRKEYDDLTKIKVIPADIGISSVMQLDLGDIKVSLIPRDSTHSRDALFVHIPKEKMLFIGDADCEDYYEEAGTYNQSRLKSLISFIENLEFEYNMLGHDEPTTKEEVLKYLRIAEKF